MAIPGKNQDISQHLGLVSTAGITCIIGLMIHLFIIGVGVIDWSKRRPLTTADLLVTSIGTSRIIFQFASLFDIFWRTFRTKYSVAFKIAINVVGNSSTYCNTWLTVLLTIFYSLKISNFYNPLFLYLKKIISQRVLGLIITFVLLSMGFSAVEALEYLVNSPKNSTEETKHYIAEIDHFSFFGDFLWNALPFLFYVISSFTILGSLFHHMHKMQHDKDGTSHLDAYVKTIKYTIVSFFCFALYLGINVFGIYCYDLLGYAGVFLVWNCFPMFHSIYLIYMNRRLRQHVFKITHGITKCLHFGRGSESKSGV